MTTQQIIECIANFSEGRDERRFKRLLARFKAQM